jgi:hypothetical protein
MWQGWISFLVGAWLIISAFAISLQGSLNMIIAGAIALIVGFIGGKAWQEIINGLLGLWILVCGIFIASLTVSQANYLIVGIVMAILGFWAGVSKPGARMPSPTPPPPPTQQPPPQPPPPPQTPPQAPPQNQ